MTGILYGVGVGPGDPELLTVKAVRLITEKDIIALPGEEPEETTAYKIAEQAVPEIREKTLIGILMPMTDDESEKEKAHRKGAERIEAYLADGQDVVFLTLGDPSLYSTFSYLQRIVEKDGYTSETVSGVPSFCAAAATLKEPLAVGEEPVHIYPASYAEKKDLPEDGTLILMKPGGSLSEVKEQIKRSGRDAAMAVNCGMEGENLYHHPDEIPEEAGYYSLLISKKYICD